MQSHSCWLPEGSFQPRRYRPGGIGNWSPHLPFAHDLITDVRPELFVELGTHYGESYFGFCQAIAENNLPCSCYAVDTWVGEEHTGYYGEEVFSEVSAYNKANYGAFSYLLRMSFDDASRNFTEDSIDILHIDGLHTYEAVSHDFHTWLPKVKPGGIVLIHDVAARHDSFGVWRLWNELEPLGNRFLFTHGWGLGVFRKSGPALPQTGLIPALFQNDIKRQNHLRKFYSLCALKLEYEYDRTDRYYAPPSSVLVQVYPFKSGFGYSAENTYNADIKPGQWQRLAIDLASGIGDGPLRIDLASQPAVIDVAAITVRKRVTDDVLWSANGSLEITALPVAGTMRLLEGSGNPEFSRFISVGNDPQLFLPSLGPDHLNQPLCLELWVRVHADVSSLLSILKGGYDIASATRSRIAQLETQLSANAEREMAYRKLQGELYVSKTDLKHARSELEQSKASLAASEAKYQEHHHNLQEQYRDLERHHRALEQHYRDLEQHHRNLGQQYRDLEHRYRDLDNHRRNLENNCRVQEQALQQLFASHSWRLTAPFRQLVSRLRS